MVAPQRWLSVFLCLGLLMGCGAASDPGADSSGEAEELSGEGQVRQQEGKVSVGTINRAQQAYFLENSKYAESLEDLDVALSPKYYTLEIVEVNDKHAIAKAVPKETDLKAYIAGVSGISQRIVCASEAPGADIASPVFQNEAWSCGSGSTQVE